MDERQLVQGVYGMNENAEKVSLRDFADLVGFPEELIRKELLVGSNINELELEDLREAMLGYLNKTMLEE